MFQAPNFPSPSPAPRITVPQPGACADSSARPVLRVPCTWQWGVKRAIDVLGALAFFALLGPLYLCIALAVCVSMGRPVHYWQARRGAGGHSFQFFKFRSMQRDSESILERHLTSDPVARAHWNQYQKLEHDPRVTSLGKFIRRLSLDELPQFWNVLKGDMSLVGPRPCLVRQQSLYGIHWHHYCAVRPGITGLWQVSGRNRLSFAERVRLDAEYVDNWSLWLDLKILAKTVRTVVTGDGSH